MKKALLFFALSLATLGTFTSCSRDDDSTTVADNYSITPTEVSIKYDQTHKFTIKNNGSEVSGSSFSWKSSDEKRGTVDANGLLTAKKVGTFDVTATKNGKTLTSKVTITPYQTFFTEPLMFFGKTKADVKASETRKLTRETTTALVYEGENSSVNRIGYIFDNNGNMTSAIVMFPTSSSSTDKVTTFYKERYLVLSTENNVVQMKHLDESIYMGMGYDSTLGFHVIYTKK
ncbi:Ig-like domain-containing protein [Riemerella anatipestifer]|uniref:Ig-like domain-containing protein n=1 Tax=Riemerella anatipestifer TaxID=34085 RepID=UPI001BDA88F5|nr:Ig-like domain-containing protein [Riemerella anatipestifer]MBT0554251.1 Ig-like domain-containing protein [Riemerella anatipestifer]MCE3025013.1 Ig-like domain-containing protein [Riemerella anatipestifer]MDY3449798.1 Ig-like domain-containing protein [Riemerella anatipestifer]QYR03379.1 Ig-like domain-containing protein [Riemerella anatipestifer]QYR05647.1 Ig-like domain-containing protein [Riemerella anatipestifer]